jgi:hypothetical protein
MNEFEKALCRSVRLAHRRYEAITGNWLFHAPEHFLQNAIMLSLGKTHEVYAEATRRKITDGMGRPPRGRPPRSRAYRFDLVVWHKTKDTLKAVIEIKRSWRNDTALQRDAERIRRSISSAQRSRAGYLVVYSEVSVKKGKELLLENFVSWADDLGLAVLNAEVMDEEPQQDGWICGFALLRA